MDRLVRVLGPGRRRFRFGGCRRGGCCLRDGLLRLETKNGIMLFFGFFVYGPNYYHTESI